MSLALAESVSPIWRRSHEQAKMLGYPLGMMAAATAPEAQQPAEATVLQIATNSSDPDLDPWLCRLLAGAPNLAVAELNLPRIPPGIPAMPNLAHLLLRAQRTCLADIQSALQAAPNLKTLLLGQDWCLDQAPNDDITAWDMVLPPRLQHLSLEYIYPSSFTVPEGCTISFTGMLKELDGMFGAAGWKLRGGCLKMLDAYGFCNNGLASVYPSLVANLSGVEVLRLAERPFYTISSATDEWVLGQLPQEATSCITTLHLTAQELAVTVPSWPALRHVKLDAHMDLMLDFEDAEASAATLQSFEISSSVEDRAGLKQFQRALAAQGKRLVTRGKGYEPPKALEQPPDAITDVAKMCCCGCCTACLSEDGTLGDARSVREIVALRGDGPSGESDEDDSEDDEFDDEEGFYSDEQEEDSDEYDESDGEL